MGKSFNDDVFNNDFDIANINGLNISQEAIEENKKSKAKMDLSHIDLGDIEEIKKELEREKLNKKLNPQEELEQLREESQRLEEQKEQEITKAQYQRITEQKEQTVKRTMIFKKEHLDIIDGLATINDMQIKDVLSQLLDKSIKELDPKIIDKAIKTSKKDKTKDSKSIF